MNESEMGYRGSKSDEAYVSLEKEQREDGSYFCLIPNR